VDPHTIVIAFDIGEQVTPQSIAIGVFARVSVNAVDGTIRGTSLGVPGYVVRMNSGSDPHGPHRDLRAAIAWLDGSYAALSPDPMAGEGPH
jgi:hypothetical protein